MSVLGKNWEIQPSTSSEMLARFPELHPVLVAMLEHRGLTTAEAVDEFLHPDWTQDVHDPYLFRDMRKAVDRIYLACERKEKITIHGDYDADGVDAAALLFKTLEQLKCYTDVYLPHREKEGYGLRNETVQKLAEQGTKVIITCDCGISNSEEIALAQSLGVDVIITDHHHVPPERPPAFATLHCGLPEETYPFKHLSGGGVAFKLAQGLLRDTRYAIQDTQQDTFEKWLLDFVAISSVADLVPLIGESRTLVSLGLLVLRKNRRPGLRALLEAAGINPEDIDPYAIGWQIAPRINAAGRMDHANAAFALLTTKDPAEAKRLAEQLQTANQERQQLTERVVAEARQQIGKLKPEQYLVSAYHPSWPVGIVGLVAGKIAQEYNRPALIMGSNGEHIVGSGRWALGLNVTETITSQQGKLIRFGGHPAACGFSLKEVDLAAFLTGAEDYARQQLQGKDLRPKLSIEAEISIAQVNWELWEALEQAQPYGMGNQTPRFLIPDVHLVSCKLMGSDSQHFRCTVADSTGKTLRAVAFRMGEHGAKLNVGQQIDLVGELSVNEWNGRRDLELRVVDFRIHNP